MYESQDPSNDLKIYFQTGYHYGLILNVITFLFF